VYRLVLDINFTNFDSFLRLSRPTSDPPEGTRVKSWVEAVVRFIILTSHSLRQQDSTDANELLEEGEREEGRKSSTPH
jgi:hypothetical protein